jgi:hypothetical protein
MVLSDIELSDRVDNAVNKHGYPDAINIIKKKKPLAWVFFLSG